MTMQEIIRCHPEWPARVQVEAWLTDIAREAGEYAESALADFGARLDDNGEADVSHLPDADVEAIRLEMVHASAVADYKDLMAESRYLA